MMKKMISERHNIAARFIIEALRRGSFGANLCFTDAGSDARLVSQGIDTTNVANRVLPPWLLPHLPEEERRHSSRPDAILIVPRNTCSTQFTTKNAALQHFTTEHFNPGHWEVHLIEFKYREDTTKSN